MELLIAEDVLLLLLDDGKGTIAGEMFLHYTLGAAVLADLDLAGRVRYEPPRSLLKGGRVYPVESDPTGDPLLDAAWESLAEKESRGAQTAMLVMGKDLRAQLTDRLVERGLVQRKDKKFLGFIPSTTWPASDARHEAALRNDITQVLRGAEPDPRTAAVIGLVTASQQVGVLQVEDLSSSELRTRALEVVKGNWVAAALKQVIETTVAGTAAATATATGVAVATTILN